MVRQRIDPAPREYAPFVTLYDRSTRGPAVAEGIRAPNDVEDWLLGPALSVSSLLELVEGFCWRLLAAGIPVHRCFLNAGTLHPRLVGLTWEWNERDGICDEVRIAADVMNSPRFLRSPVYQAMATGEAAHYNLRNPDTVARFGLFNDLVGQDITDYDVLPLTTALGINPNLLTITLASRTPGTLQVENFAPLARLLRLLTPHVARLMALRIASHITSAYLGEAAGRQVLDGTIQRGAGAPVEAVILVADLRRFTELSGRLPPDQMLKVLNAYFEALAVAIGDAGGEVLKFMGDGLLAVFPIDAAHARETAAAEAYGAAEQALAALDRLNAEPPEPLAGIEGWRPLRAGIGLHAGEVFFGNVGAPERLDFTVIGPAVNIAARLESLTKDLKRPLLVSGPVARMLGQDLEAMGDFHLRGIDQPVQVFAQPSADKDQS